MQTQDWTQDPRVAPLLESMAKRPPAIEHYQDYSNSSWGMKTYWRYTGQRFRELCAIWEAYGAAIFDAKEYDHDAALAWGKAPRPAELVEQAKMPSQVVA
jgi:hypothetical protein